MREVTIYVADDGARFDTLDACLAHELVLTRASEIMAPLGVPAMLYAGYIQHDPGITESARTGMLKLMLEYVPTSEHYPKWVQQALNEGNVHPSWIDRLIGDGIPAAFSGPWRRLGCIDIAGREWGSWRESFGEDRELRCVEDRRGASPGTPAGVSR